MNAHHLPTTFMPNWFDAVVLIVLLWGLNRGRKHGMSEELLVTAQWVVIISVGALFYRPLGDWLATTSPVSHLFCYITIYICLAIAIKIGFGLFKKMIGGKLVGSDVFGSAEYYLGMVAGAVRYACMLFAFLAIMNAPYYSAQDMAAMRAYDNDVYGSNFFPSVASIQQDIFTGSIIGNLVKERAGKMLIASTKSENVGVRHQKEFTLP